MRAQPPELHVNHAFCLHMARKCAPAGRILDYGCGAGETVEAGMKQGLDIFGTDVFYGAGPERVILARDTGLLGTRIRKIEDNIIPFDDGYFDFVFHNQVFEHVPDIEVALANIRRVLRPGGMMLSIFPSRGVPMEGHCKVPFIHWFGPESRISYLLLRSARSLRFGYPSSGQPPREWALYFREWVHRWCYYRTRRDIVAAYSRFRFDLRGCERDYVEFRLRYLHNDRLIPVLAPCAPVLRSLLGIIALSR